MSPQSNLLIMFLASPVNTPFITLIANIFFTIFWGKTHELFINRTQTSSTSQDLRAQDLNKAM